AGRASTLHSFPTRRSSDLPAEQWNLSVVDAPETAVSETRAEAGLPSTELASTSETSESEVAQTPVVDPNYAFSATRGLEQVILRSEEHTSELQSRENLVCR